MTDRALRIGEIARQTGISRDTLRRLAATPAGRPARLLDGLSSRAPSAVPLDHRRLNRRS